MVQLSLIRQGSPLASPEEQIRQLERVEIPGFDHQLEAFGLAPLCASGLDVLQINVGRLCNQTCAHCHVDAGPDRREIMSWETMQDCLRAARLAQVKLLDITGGAPEMNPHFRKLVQQASELGCRMIDRCNLTILMAPGFQDLPEFLAEHKVEIVASLPCYLAENTDRQRGNGVFQQSIAALRRLNQLGYGHADTGLELSLVFNPTGLGLPPDQSELEAEYRRELARRYDVEFNRLITITNMPISRFLDDLVRNQQLERYMELLVNAFNPEAVHGLMCRNTLSVNWDGRLHDCDFNQMLELTTDGRVPQHIRDFEVDSLKQRRIVTGKHCFGCTAGAGSGCQGATTSAPSGNG